MRGLSEIAGGVRIQIASPKWGIESVKIFAFGRDIIIPDAELAKLIGAAYSEVSISCDGGYKEAGGTTIYITLCFTDMFEGDPFKGDPMLQQRIRIAVSDSMPVRVTKE